MVVQKVKIFFFFSKYIRAVIYKCDIFVDVLSVSQEPFLSR